MTSAYLYQGRPSHKLCNSVSHPHPFPTPLSPSFFSSFLLSFSLSSSPSLHSVTADGSHRWRQYLPPRLFYPHLLILRSLQLLTALKTDMASVQTGLFIRRYRVALDVDTPLWVRVSSAFSPNLRIPGTPSNPLSRPHDKGMRNAFGEWPSTCRWSHTAWSSLESNYFNYLQSNLCVCVGGGGCFSFFNIHCILTTYLGSNFSVGLIK